ncbi:DUF4250 domain-containing protein [Echinimonas agarilytica]|uniref:DUF4250 domain-containing protein n=1 Tax=Echinimonas agarilytica TaxID=1215918 RepID=A0AA41W6C5_9GAMM|nr:DUF4250 domain-containing protein [Echinimonas agarilytica]MCM2679655.1 DUF4250 domain-containing protein [Echinimonas agarilytica]
MQLSKRQLDTMDAFMLLSMVNMKLRDEYNSLDSLCSSCDIPKSALKVKMGSIDMEYYPDSNQFR